ncbi:MAG TPA: VgrG-related protein [Roseiflexaceae bacterium]|nr:VgrG-related protein [Roseiflexaceae bacterium]
MPPTERRIGQFVIQVNGNDLPPEAMDQLDDAIVEQDLAQPAMFALRFNDPQLKLIDGNLLRPGAEIKLSADDPAGSRAVLLIGEITAIEQLLEQQNIVLLARGYDRSHRLHRGSRTRTFIKESDDGIASQIARENGLRADVESVGERHEYVIQDNQTDMEFLRDRAARVGFQVVVDDRTLRFRRTDTSPAAAPAQEWGENLLSFRTRLTTAAQPTEVHVRGWDPKAKKAIVGKAQRPAQPSQIGESQPGGKLGEAAFGSPSIVTITDRPVRTQSEADRMAQAILNQLSGDYLAAEGVSLGNPGLRAGNQVEIKNIGTRLSGKYFITAARHEYTAQTGYTTTFFVSGHRPSDLLAAISGPPPRNAAPGVAVAIVTNINDPDKLGRVRLRFPWLDDSHESDWARVATPGAGAGRGLSVLPEVDDEVLVAFEHGSLDRPYVIGGLWNGKDKPPAEAVKGGKVQSRTLTTRAGHQISIYDDDGAGKIEIKTQKHTIVLEDSGAGKLSIESGGDFELKSTGGKLSITSSGVELSSNASLKIQANAMLDINTNAIMNLKGSLININ